VWLQTLFAEFAITLTDGSVWLSIGQALLSGAVCVLLGTWVARWVGLLEADAPAEETLGVGLASGLLVVASWWAAIASGGRSSFTPVAVGFAIAIVLAAVRRMRPTNDRPSDAAAVHVASEASASRSVRRGNLIVALLGGALFVVAVALLYGSTLTPRPRDGVQPIEFRDEAYYSILGADLAKTGTESLYSPSGFTEIEGVPSQTWYHWGEAWLGAAVITIFGSGPLEARHFVVLPLLLLAAATLTGTLVRRVTESPTRGAFLFGFLACLFLTPVAFIPGPHFSSWAVGLIFGITSYGLAAVAVLLAMYSLAVLGRRQANWALAAFVGSAVAMILPAHVVIAVLALVGAGSVWAMRIVGSLVAARRPPQMAPIWRRTYIATGVAVVATVAWGSLSRHGVGSTGLSPSVSPFNASWAGSVAVILLGAGAFLAIGVAWFMVSKKAPVEAGLYLGTIVLLIAGALVWGALLADFNTFHLFFAGIVVFATPVAAVAVWRVWLRLRATGHARLAVAVLLVCATQVELGIGLGLVRLQGFGPGSYPPVAVELLAAIRRLPADAKLAYACQPFEEVAFWTANLLSIDAHTGRRIVPMCFQAEVFVQFTGAQMSVDVPSALFRSAPQGTLYPDSGAHPSPASVTSFLKANGIDYIYVDGAHPNSLVPDAVPIATSGETQVLRIP
jgi:hypothetical protein